LNQCQTRHRRDHPDPVIRPGVNEHHRGRRQPVTEKYSPAFRFGHGLATTEPFRSQSWETIEPDVRQLWEEKNPGTWEQLKDAVRFSWERVRGAREPRRTCLEGTRRQYCRLVLSRGLGGG